MDERPLLTTDAGSPVAVNGAAGPSDDPNGPGRPRGGRRSGGGDRAVRHTCRATLSGSLTADWENAI
jgi:hypothetical protein